MSPLRISLCPNGDAINFPDFDSGTDLDVIEEVLLRSGLRRKAAWSSPLEDVRLFGTKTGDVVLRWDGYFTDLVADRDGVRLLELFGELSNSPHFDAFETRGVG